MQKPSIQPKPVKKDDNIMDFTKTGLSQNDVRRKSLSDAEMARKIREFEAKKQRLKERPIEDTVQPKVKGQRSSDSTKRQSDCGSRGAPKSREIVQMSDSDSDSDNDQTKGDFDPFKSSSMAKEGSERRFVALKYDKNEKHKHKHKSHKSDKEKDRIKKHKKSKKSSNDNTKSKHSVHSKPSNEKTKSKHSVDSSKKHISVKTKARSPPPVKKKPKRAPPKGPPPMSFMQLLSVAQENKNNPKSILKAGKLPVVGEKVDKNQKKLPEPKRPMTQDEKERFYRTHTPEYKQWLKCGGQRPNSEPSPVKKRQDGGTASVIKGKEMAQMSDSEDEDDYRSSQSNSQTSGTSSKSNMSGQRHTGLNSRTGNSVSVENFNNTHKPNGKMSGKPTNGIHSNQASSEIKNLSDKNKQHTLSQAKNSKSDQTLHKSQGTKKADSSGTPANGTNKPRPNPYKDTTNPFDRIYGQIQQRNPKKGNVRRFYCGILICTKPLDN